MLLHADLISKIWGVRGDAILHVGAHHAEELDDYLALGWGRTFVYWVEALPSALGVLAARLNGLENHHILQAVAWNSSGEKVTFTVTNNEQSSSALPLDEHMLVYPEVVPTQELQLTTSALQDVIPRDDLQRISLINLDIQGAELRALEGLGSFIKIAEAVYSEVNLRSLYRGCSTFEDMKSFMAKSGFVLVDWELLAEGWGDALWLRNDKCPRKIRLRRYFRRCRSRARQVAGVMRRLFLKFGGRASD